jgi:hypothetical protein
MREEQLIDKYGSYHKGMWIEDHEKHHYYMQRPKLRRRKIILGWLCMCIPIMGIIGLVLYYEEIGLSIL